MDLDQVPNGAVAMRMEWTLELDPIDTAPRTARRAVAARVGTMDPCLLNDLQLLVSEVVTNAVRHGGAIPTDTIVLSLVRAGDEVQVEVCDPGRAGGEPAVDDAAPWTRPGGHGLRMVERLSSSWGARRNSRTCVWFCFACV